jgi:cytochrome c oxidase subunit 4
MNAHLRNPLTYVWAFLTAITISSWWLSQGVGIQTQVSVVATSGVLLIAAVKVHFVLRYFMEVRRAPVWLKRITVGWLILLLILLFGFYGVAMH